MQVLGVLFGGMAGAGPNRDRLSVTAASTLQMLGLLADEGLGGAGRARLELHATALADPRHLEHMATCEITEHGFGLRAELATLDGPVSTTLHSWVDQALRNS